MNYEIKITEIDAWLNCRPFEGESDGEFSVRWESLRGKFYLRASLIDAARQKRCSVESPYYTREEGNSVATHKLFYALAASLAAHEERMIAAQTTV
jgi:hypothetical protein